MASDSASGVKHLEKHPGQRLPEQEQKRRRRDWWLVAGVIVVVLATFLVRRRLTRLPDALPFADSALFLLLNVSSVVLITLLVYLIGRQFVKLVFERRAGALGAHLNLKFVLALFLVAAVPTTALFLVSSSFIKGSFDSWFTLQMDRAVEQSREIADATYATWTDSTLHFGEQIARQITEQRMLREDNLDGLNRFLKEKQSEYNLGVVQVFPFVEGQALATLINPEIPSAAFASRSSALVTSAFEGERVSLVESTGSEIGDVIRGAVPILSSDPARPNDVVGVVVVNHLVPHPLLQRVTNIRAAREEYGFFKSLAGEIVGVYQLALLLFALTFVLLTIWWGLRMAHGVTNSIRVLIEGTERVAKGDLDVALPQRSDDEIGLLVHSFNRMTHDLKQALTSLEHSNTELEQRRSYMEVVLHHVNAGVVSLNAEGRISTINPAARRLLAVTPGEGVGSKLEELMDHPTLLEVIGDLALQARAGVRGSMRRQVQLTIGEETLTLVVTLSLLQDEARRALGSVIVFDDYTHEVRAQRMATWREVARHIAHEIKNPLTPIRLSAQRLRRRFRAHFGGEDAQVFDEAVDTITSHVDGLKVLVNEFSQFARLPQANLKSEDLNGLVQEAVSSYAGTDGVAFHAELDDTLPRIDFDREQFRRVLSNFFENARAACATTPGTGHVVVRTMYDALRETARLEVADDGVGIRDEDRRHIFEPYYSTKDHGTGLGLAIVSRIVADHHGYVRVYPNHPLGARFVVELPLKAA